MSAEPATIPSNARADSTHDPASTSNGARAAFRAPFATDTSIIGVVGATGAVGRELLRVLGERGIAPDRVRATAGDRSAGSRLPLGSTELEVTATTPAALAPCDLVFLCADANTSRALAPACVARGAVVIDNSSAFRLDPDVPLVVPEVNGHVLDVARVAPEVMIEGANDPPRGTVAQANGHVPGDAADSATRDGGVLIANPNCSTIILLIAIEALRRRWGLRAINVCTYQAVSGAGLAAVDELRDSAREALSRESINLWPAPAHAAPPPGALHDAQGPGPRVFREPCAFNVFSHDSSVDLSTGLNGEEAKIIAESRRIVGDAALRISPTCVRVPVVRAHTMAITVELGAPALEREVREALSRAEGVRVIDDRAGNSFPTPLKASGGDDVLVGRIRRDPGAPLDRFGRTHGFSLLACADQLRRGAATNAMRIAERLGAL